MKTKMIEPPHWLSQAAKDIYVKTALALGDNFNPVTDESVLADFAEAQADVIELSQDVRMVGMVVTSKTTKNTYCNPTLSILQSRRKDLERLRVDLGLTPESRGVKLLGPKSKSGLAQAMEKK